MRRLLLLLTVAALGTLGLAQMQSSATSGQAAAKVRKSPLESYAGTWVSELDGKPWLTLNLTLRGEQLSGSLQRPLTMQFTDQGNLKSVSDDRLVEPVEQADINPNGLLLSVKNEQTEKIEHFTMRLTGESTAEFRMSAMSMPPGMPKLNPWKLTRAASSPPAGPR